MHSTAKSNAANPCQRGKSFGWFLIEILFITAIDRDSKTFAGCGSAP
jgi:hypothetical protein